MTNPGMSDDDLMKIMPKETPATKLEAGAANTIAVHTTRKLMIIGCGDGGCNIATAIGKKLQGEAHVIAYNTSTRAMNDVVAATKILPGNEDGSGKIRDYSKEIFKNQIFKQLLDSAHKAIETKGPFAYIIVCTTADGGTGSGMSPMAAKLLADNTGIPVIIFGVYPSIQEDATAQYNAMQWQTEVAKINVPYFIFDNDQPGMTKPKVHEAVNEYAALVASLIAGKEFGNTNIQMIDDRNLYMLLAHVGLGARAVAAVSTTRLQTTQSLDAYVGEILKANYQPLPENLRGLGIFVKGPKTLLDKLDVSVPGIQSQYGNALIHFEHIEEGEDIKIAVLMTGCAEASTRLVAMKNRYDDIMEAQKSKTSVLGTIMEDSENPMGTVVRKSAVEEPDLSALEL